MIETVNSQIATEIRTFYLKVLQKLTVEESRTVAVHHFGILSQDLINSLADGVEGLMVSFGDQKKTIKRTFSILIEGLQNIRIHASKDELDRQLAFLFIARNTETYKIMMGNIVQKSQIEQLNEYVKHINEVDPAELKDLYLKILSSDYLSQKGGAGLGLLIMRMKSENPLSFSFIELKDDKSLFVVDVIMNRK